jgi:hypothetical protein
MRLDFPEAPAHERPRGEPAASVKITFYPYAGGLGRDPRLSSQASEFLLISSLLLLGSVPE